MIDVFFNRPGKPWPVERLVEDIMGEHGYVVVVSAWLSERRVVRAICDGPSKFRCLVLSAAPESVWQAEALRPVFDLAEASDGSIALWRLADYGSGGGFMHHKFIYLEKQGVVWCGSSNFTTASTRNYENILRITEPAIVKQFAEEGRHICGVALEQWEAAQGEGAAVRA